MACVNAAGAATNGAAAGGAGGADDAPARATAGTSRLSSRKARAAPAMLLREKRGAEAVWRPGAAAVHHLFAMPAPLPLPDRPPDRITLDRLTAW